MTGVGSVDMPTQDLAVELLIQKSTPLWVLVGRSPLAFPQAMSKYTQRPTCLAS